MKDGRTKAQIIAKAVECLVNLVKEGDHVQGDIESGYLQTENWNTGFYCFEPNGTYTLTIRINGGARVTHQ